jgi:hypothetical protein
MQPAGAIASGNHQAATGAITCSHVAKYFYFDYMTNNMGPTVCKLTATGGKEQPKLLVM